MRDSKRDFVVAVQNATPRIRGLKYWEIIADNLSKAGWNWGCVLALDAQGRTIWIADAHHDDGLRFVVRADEKLTAFLELEGAIRYQAMPDPKIQVGYLIDGFTRFPLKTLPIKKDLNSG